MPKRNRLDLMIFAYFRASTAMVIFGFRKIDEIISKTSESSGCRSLIARDSAAFSNGDIAARLTKRRKRFIITSLLKKTQVRRCASLLEIFLSSLQSEFFNSIASR